MCQVPISNDLSFDHCHNQNGFFSNSSTPLTASSFGTSPQSPQMFQKNSEIVESFFSNSEQFVGSKNLEDIE
jgi:hypothetical protein